MNHSFKFRLFTAFFKYAFSFLFLFAAVLNLYPENKIISWNEADIKWLSYEDGMKEAAGNGFPVLIILYADWCPACKSYSKLFHEDAVIELSKKFAMIRINVDDNPDLSEKYGLDGEYIPRTYFLHSDGKIMEEMYPQRKYRFFIGNRLENLKWFMEDALDED